VSHVLDGRWTAITGGSKGIGRGIAARFIDNGANVVLIARDETNLAVAADELRGQLSAEQQLLTIPADVSAPESIGELFDELHNKLPRLDVFVANAGSGTTRPFLEITAEEWSDIVAINLTGTFLCCQAAARMMTGRPDEDRSILVVSSIRATSTLPGRTAYSASKAAVNQMVRAAARELAVEGIRVNALSPGITETPLTQRPEHRPLFEAAAAQVPLQRAGLPRDMAAAALFLSSPEAAFVTGANLVVDGGESLT
jgi:glucose 1-dehydrogenase